MTMTDLVYSDGAATVSGGSTAVVGSGTAWAIALVTGGCFSAMGYSIPIAAVVDDTHLTLAYAWPAGHSSSGAIAYAIARETSEAVRAAWINDRLAKILDTLSLAGIHPDGAGTLAERNAYSPPPANGFLFLRVESGYDLDFYKRTSSGWDGPFPTRGVGGVGSGGLGLPTPGAANKFPYYSAPNTIALGDVSTGAIDNALLLADGTAGKGIKASTKATLSTAGVLVVNKNAAALPAPATSSVLQIGNADATSASYQATSFAAPSQIILDRADGTAAAKAALATSTSIGSIHFRGWGGSTFATSGQVRATTTQAHTESARGTSVDVLTTPNGSIVAAVAATFDQDKAFKTFGPNYILVSDPGATIVAMEIDLEGGNGVFRATRYANSANAPVFFGQKARGTRALPTGVQSGDTLLGFRGMGHNGTAFTLPGQGASFLFEAAQAWVAGSAYGSQMRFQTILNGTIVAGDALFLGNDKTVAAYGLLDLSAATAGQVKFPATQNPSSDANTLDDYEEGTFTPIVAGETVNGTGTYSLQVGRYTKLGNLVSVSADETHSAHTGTGNTLVTLPFTAAANPAPCLIPKLNNYTFTGVPVFQIVASTNFARLQTQATGAALAAIAIDTAASIGYSGVFHV